jgi:cytochrome c5
VLRSIGWKGKKVAMKSALLLGLAVALAAPQVRSQTVFSPRGERVYETTCVICHSAGISGAPKLGDKSAWAERLAKGKETLVNSALKGKGLMPPRGSNPKFDDEDIRAAVDYMVAASK